MNRSCLGPAAGCEGLASGLPRKTGPEPGLGQLDIIAAASESPTLGLGVKGLGLRG